MNIADLIRRLPARYREAAAGYLQTFGVDLYSLGATTSSSAADTMADRLAARAADPSATPDRETTARGAGFSSRADYSPWTQSEDDPYGQYFNETNRGTSRKRCYQDAHQMDCECPEISRALDSIAANASGSEDGTEVTFSYGAKDNDSEVMRIMDGVAERTRLQNKVAAQIRSSVKFGDIFEEIVADQAGLIWDVNALPQTTMNRVEQGGLCHGYFQTSRSGGVHASWGPRWILHMRHNAEDGAIYGRSQMFSARKPYTQLSMLEDGTVIMVLERAGQKIVHTIAVPDDHAQAELAKDQYKKWNIRRLSYDSTRGGYTGKNTPLGRTDYILPKKIGPQDKQPEGLGIEAIDGQHNFDKVIVVNEYFQRKILIALGVPPVYLGIEKDVNSKSTALHQELEFGRFLRRIQAQFAQAYKERVFGFQFQLLGMDVEDDRFWVRFPEPSKTDERIKAEVFKLNMEAAKILNDSYGVPLDAVLVHFLGWGASEAEEIATRLGAPTEETEGMGRRKKAEMLGQLREKLFAPNEIGTYFADWLSKMADAADYYRAAAA